MFLSHGREFFFCFWVWASVCVWVCVPNVKGKFGRDPRAPPPPLVVTDLSPLSLFYYIFFLSLLFWFLLVWVFVSLRIEFSYGDNDMVIFYWGLKCGFRYSHLQICGYFYIWSLSQNGSNMVFLLVYAHESVCMFGNLGFLGF